MKLTHKHVKTFFIVLTILASIKMLLQNFSLDEEYHLLMSYRNIMGDTMFSTMWEPHQTSSFLCTLFMWPYYLITGTFTGVVIYLRLIGTLIHFGVAYYLYKVLKHFLEEELSFYIALIFFNTIPKQIMLPEFSGMQVWFGVLCFLTIIDSVENITFVKADESTLAASPKQYLKIAVSAIFMCLEVLSYPSCILLFVPFLIMIVFFHKEKRYVKGLLFTGVCTLFGVLFAGFLILKNGIAELLLNIPSILNADLTHEFVASEKWYMLYSNLLHYAISFAILTVAAWGLSLIPAIRKHLPERRDIAFLGLVLLLSNLYQLMMWIGFNKGYEYLQIHLAVTLCLGLWILFLRLKARDTFAKYMWCGTILGFLSLVCVMLLTNLNLLSSMPHAMLASICMLTLFAHIGKEHPKYIYIILTAFCLTATIGKGYTLRGGFGNYNNVLQSEGICKHGPAIGTISTYMGAYIYNNEYKLWQDAIPDESNVLVVTNNVQSANTVQYMFKKANVCHYSVIDPAAYDEHLLTYWERHPEKEPDIIVIDCWFGNMKFNEDSWIVTYIENDFGYSEVIDGDYVRIYKK